MLAGSLYIHAFMFTPGLDEMLHWPEHTKSVLQCAHIARTGVRSEASLCLPIALRKLLTNALQLSLRGVECVTVNAHAWTSVPSKLLLQSLTQTQRVKQRRQSAVPAALWAAPSGNKGDTLPDMMDSWEAKESSMIGVRVALAGRPLPDIGRPPADIGRGGLPADAGLDTLGLQPTS